MPRWFGAPSVAPNSRQRSRIHAVELGGTRPPDFAKATTGKPGAFSPCAHRTNPPGGRVPPLVHNLIKVNGRSHRPYFFHGAATTSYPAGVLWKYTSSLSKYSSF